MCLRLLSANSFIIVFFLITVPWLDYVLAQVPASGTLGGQSSRNMVATVDLSITLEDPVGKAVPGSAVVILSRLSGEVFRQDSAKSGHVLFAFIPPTEYNIQVIAPSFQRAVMRIDAQNGKSVTEVTVKLQPMSTADATLAARIVTLKPKAQRELSKAMEALRVHDLNATKKHLETVHKWAPDHVEVNYLLGVYFSEAKNSDLARTYWTKALESDPKHEGALLGLSEMLLHDNKAADAMPLLNRAVEAEPSAWRAHAMLASANLRLGAIDDAIKESHYALELGHQDAAIVQRLLASALAKSGERERAIGVLQIYVHDHPADAQAKSDLDRIQSAPPHSGTSGEPSEGTALDRRLVAAQQCSSLGTEECAPSRQDQPSVEGAGSSESAVDAAATSLPLPSSWLPPGVDDKIPPIEPGAACPLQDVLQNVGKRMEEFVANIDRYSATESIFHQSVDKWGLVSDTEGRRFGYVAEISEIKQGNFNVEEYRSVEGFPGEFPGGVETRGLPALALIFHPHSVANFEMTCEGLAQRGGGLAWQIHFRQRPDRPNTMKHYRIGAEGQSYPVAIKGRAWIAADTYQIVRLETDLVAPIRIIRLSADRAAVDYGPVHFREKQIDLWLPQSADVYFDWQNHRVHRRHIFTNYLLFSVDDKQQIANPNKEPS